MNFTKKILTLYTSLAILYSLGLTIYRRHQNHTITYHEHPNLFLNLQGSPGENVTFPHQPIFCAHNSLSLYINSNSDFDNHRGKIGRHLQKIPILGWILKFIAVSWSRNQRLTPTQQYDAGARCQDIRVTYNTERDEFMSSHSLESRPLIPDLIEAADWARNHRAEPLFLSFYGLYGMNSTTEDTLIHTIRGIFTSNNSSISFYEGDVLELTPFQVRTTQRNVIVLWAGKRTEPWIHSREESVMEDVFNGRKIDSLPVMTDVFRNYTSPPNSLFPQFRSIKGNETPNALIILTGLLTLRDLETTGRFINHHFAGLLDGDLRGWVRYGGILSYDFIEQGGLIDKTVCRMYDRYGIDPLEIYWGAEVTENRPITTRQYFGLCLAISVCFLPIVFVWSVAAYVTKPIQS